MTSEEFEQFIRQLPDPNGLMDRLAPQEVYILTNALQGVVENPPADMQATVIAALQDIGPELEVKNLEKKFNVAGLLGSLSNTPAQ
jgi:hypothetical protein